MSEWRLGGFQEWLARQELWAQALDLKDFAADLDDEPTKMLADDLATVLAARYAALISKWDGSPDEKFEGQARNLNGLCRTVLQLQRGMHQTARDNREYIQALDERDKQSEEEIKGRKLQEIWSLAHLPHLAKGFGGGDWGQAMAEYIVKVQSGLVDAKLEFPGKEKTEKPVQPTTQRQTAKRAGKTRAEKADKPLEENEMEEEMEEETSQAQSSPVKPGKTDLEQPEEGGLGVRLGVN